MRLFLGIFFITVLSWIWACDEIKEVAPTTKPIDSTVTLIQNKDYYSPPNNFIAIDTKVLLKSSGYASIKVENTPQYGKISFSKTGYLVYKSDSTKNEVTEVLIYKMMNGDPTKDKRDTLKINITSDASKIPCNAGAIPDFFTIKVNTSSILDVLANDRYCNAIVDSTSFQIIDKPVFGTAKIENNKVVYTPRNNYDQNDIFFYQICTKGTNPVCKVVGVRINIEGTTCRNILVPDVIVIDKNDTTSKIIKVLGNDKICDNYDPKSLKITSQPQYGKAVINTKAEIVYTQTSKKEGNDLFEYTIYDKSGANPQKMLVEVLIRTMPVCKTYIKNGQMEISASQLKDAEVEIPYFLYASYCTEIKDIKIESQPTYGMIRIEDKKLFYRLKQQDGKEYNDQFKYVVTTTNNEILKANFTIRIKK
jgi:Bacterial Ig domain